MDDDPVPEPGVDPLAVPPAASGTVGALDATAAEESSGWRGLKVSTAAVPSTVVVRTMGARRTSGS